jgi:CheY-like chemotaxis protein
VPGSGSVFHVTIDPGPLEGVRRSERFPSAEKPAPRALAPAPGPVPLLSGRVLLAEDVAVNRQLVAMILERSGVEVECAENGRQALERALAANAAGQPFDILFMDIQMPEMDGYEATRRLRAAGYPGPVVALTSHSLPEERERCLAAGCDEFMTKPVDRLALLQVLMRFLPAARTGQQEAAS